MVFRSRQILKRILGRFFINQNNIGNGKSMEEIDCINAIVEDRKAHLNPMQELSYAQNPLKIQYARNQYLYEQGGSKVLDCINNVSHIGHCNPFFLKQVSAQMYQLQTNSRFLYDQLMSTTHKLLKKMPSQLSVVTFVNSGSEANDLAMQMAQIHSKKKGVICLDGAYHGISRSCMQVSPYKWSEAPHFVKDENIVIARSPCCYRGMLRYSSSPEQDYAQHIASIIRPDTGAFISELMQSCAGQIVPPRSLYQPVYEVLKDQGIVTIADEVQTGFGRLGEYFWAFEYYGVVPDILTIGKAMGNGFPVAAVICTKEIAASFKSHGVEFFSTYGGSPMAMAAVSSVLDAIDSLKLQEKAILTGKHLHNRLTSEILPFKFVGQIRGMGLFQGIDIVQDKETRLENGVMAKKIIMKMRAKNILVSRDGVHGNVLKIKPPMLFNSQNVDLLINELKQTMIQLQNQPIQAHK